MTEVPTLETARLRLRKLTLDDAQAVMTIRGDYEVTRYNIGPAYTDIHQAIRLIEGILEDCAAGVFRWGITLKTQPTVVGMVGFNQWSRDDRRASVGFDLARAHWGQGIMREALNAVLTYGFNTMGLNRIEADASAHNATSCGLLLKMGFQEEGRLREHYFEGGAHHDLLLFGLLSREYDPLAGSDVTHD